MSEVNALNVGRFVIPDLVSTHFHIRTGDKVGDIGAGSGYFVPTLSRLVGREGTVYAVDVQKSLVEKLGELTRKENLNNIEVVWGDCDDLNGSKIPDDELDVAILVNTFFQFEKPAEALEEMKRIIRPGGKLFIIDWSESFGGLGPHPDQVKSETETKNLAAAAGFQFERDFDAGDHHYGLAFRL